MKTELTPELSGALKQSFYAAYWGQKVMADNFRPDKTFMVDIQDALRERSYLRLRNLSNITDEEAIEVAKILYQDPIDEDFAHSARAGRWYLTCAEKGNKPMPLFESAHIIDYLRSQGFALPYLGISIEQMVEVGWIRLQSPQAD